VGGRNSNTGCKLCRTLTTVGQRYRDIGRHSARAITLLQNTHGVGSWEVRPATVSPGSARSDRRRWRRAEGPLGKGRPVGWRASEKGVSRTGSRPRSPFRGPQQSGHRHRQVPGQQQCSTARVSDRTDDEWKQSKTRRVPCGWGCGTLPSTEG
jgi:hypothetical protein